MGLFHWKKTEGRKNNDRRCRHHRIYILLRINYQAANGVSRYNCNTKDISEGGVCFGLYQPLEIGMALKIQIYPQNSTESIVLLGSVAWIKETPGKEYPYEVGIKFDEFCGPAISRIKDQIQSISIEKKT